MTDKSKDLPLVDALWSTSPTYHPKAPRLDRSELKVQEDVEGKIDWELLRSRVLDGEEGTGD